MKKNITSGLPSLVSGHLLSSLQYSLEFDFLKALRCLVQESGAFGTMLWQFSADDLKANYGFFATIDTKPINHRLDLKVSRKLLTFMSEEPNKKLISMHAESMESSLVSIFSYCPEARFQILMPLSRESQPLGITTLLFDDDPGLQVDDTQVLLETNNVFAGAINQSEQTSRVKADAVALLIISNVLRGFAQRNGRKMEDIVAEAGNQIASHLHFKQGQIFLAGQAREALRSQNRPNTIISLSGGDDPIIKVFKTGRGLVAEENCTLPISTTTGDCIGVISLVGSAGPITANKRELIMSLALELGNSIQN